MKLLSGKYSSNQILYFLQQQQQQKIAVAVVTPSPSKSILDILGSSSKYRQKNAAVRLRPVILIHLFISRNIL